MVRHTVKFRLVSLGSFRGTQVLHNAFLFSGSLKTFYDLRAVTFINELRFTELCLFVIVNVNVKGSAKYETDHQQL